MLNFIFCGRNVLPARDKQGDSVKNSSSNSNNKKSPHCVCVKCVFILVVVLCICSVLESKNIMEASIHCDGFPFKIRHAIREHPYGPSFHRHFRHAKNFAMKTVRQYNVWRLRHQKSYSILHLCVLFFILTLFVRVCVLCIITFVICTGAIALTDFTFSLSFLFIFFSNAQTCVSVYSRTHGLSRVSQ